MNRFTALVASVIGICLLAGVVLADTIILKNGEKLSGRVTVKADDRVLIKLDAGGSKIVAATEIDRIEKTPATANVLAPTAERKARRKKRRLKMASPKNDRNNLFDPSWINGAGKVVPKASWDGSAAVRARSGYPSFNIPLRYERKPIYDKMRGKWVKIYMDTKGGWFALMVVDFKTKDSRWFWCTAALNQEVPFNNKTWTRISHTFQIPDKEYAEPGMVFYFMRGGQLYDNIRVYLLGTEPPEVTAPVDQMWNPALENFVEDHSFETLGAAAVLAPGWHLEDGGARLDQNHAHTGKRSLKLMSNSTVNSPSVPAEKDVPLVVHFWARGRGALSVSTLDLDAVGTSMMQGVSAVGVPIAREIPISDKWVKIELTSHSYHPDCHSRKIAFSTSKGSDIFIDDVQILRDTDVFPLPQKKRNPFQGAFTAVGGQVEATLGGKPLAAMRKGITGPDVLMLKVTADLPAGNAGAVPVRITGGLTFDDGGLVGPDRFWMMQSGTEPKQATALDYDDSRWKPVALTPDGKAIEVKAGRLPVWLRRVVLWNTTSYLVPRVTQLPFDVGRADWLNLALSPPIPVKINSFQLLVDVPKGYRMVPYKAMYAAYLWSPIKLEELPGGATHNGKTYRRFAATYDPGRITGAAGSYRGGRSSTSTVLLEHLGGEEPVDGKLFLARVTNGNIVDLPEAIDLVRVPLDGTRPKKIIVHDLLSPPYTIRNPPNAQLNIEAADKIVQTCIRSGITLSAWPYKGNDAYVKDPNYGPKWLSFMRKKQIELMPMWQDFPFRASADGLPYRIARRSPGAIIAEQMKKTADGKEVVESVNISYDWLLSDASDEYWKAVREQYGRRKKTTEEATGLPVTACSWDYEFEIRSYTKADDPAIRKRFAKWAKIDGVPDWATINRKYSGQWHKFSLWANRQIIRKTRDLVMKPLGMKFHVYYGEGRPFDKDDCDIISSYRLGQNVSGQIKSVREEYEKTAGGKEIDPNMMFIGVLQAEIQGVHRGRPFHWQEFRNNCVKRAVSTHGGGIFVYTEVEPQCPGLPYATAAATRIIAKWEDYFVKPDPVFAGKELDAIVKITPKPADVVLLKKDNKGLLLLFGDEPEQQDKPVKIQLNAASGTNKEIMLEPMGLEPIELEL